MQALRSSFSDFRKKCEFLESTSAVLVRIVLTFSHINILKEFLGYTDYEFDPVKALQEIGVNQNEATKQASLKYLDKFGQPASDDFTM